MPLDLAAMTFGTLLWAASSAGVPTFNTHPTCAGADSLGFTNRTVDTCLKSEQQARDQLAAKWNTFPAADRSRCVAETGVGGFPSYVQVQVCLDLLNDARREKLDSE